MASKIIDKIGGDVLEVRGRITRLTIALVSFIVLICGVINFFIGNKPSYSNYGVLFFYALTLVGIILSYKLDLYDIALAYMGFVIVFYLSFLMHANSDVIYVMTTMWMAFSIIYIIAMLEGRTRIVELIVSTLIYAYCFAHVIESTYVFKNSTVKWALFVSAMLVGYGTGLLILANVQSYKERHSYDIQMIDKTEQKVKAKSLLYAKMTHDNRTLINAITGMNEMILRNDITPEVRDYANDIQEASRMLLNQVNDILDLSQIEFDGMRIIPKDYNIKGMLSEVINLAYVQAKRKGLELYVDVDKHTPSVLHGDSKRIKQILLNLIDNAIKYTKDGHISVSINGEKLVDNKYKLRMVVADTGIGIRKEEIEHIYDSFNRVDTEKNENIVGSGLGLSITKQLVDMMHGKIEIDSIYTQGTVFTIAIEQEIIDSKPVGIVESFRREEAEEIYKPIFESKEARILVVDDNMLNVKIITNLLKQTKVQIDVANSGYECLRLAKKRYYHVILMDYMMPEMSGEEVLEALRVQENGLCRNSAILAVTANNIQDARESYIKKGFDGYVEKPINGKQLEREILEVLPSEIVDYAEYPDDNVSNLEVRNIVRKKKKKISITSDCISDIPEEVLKTLDIKLMYMYVKTPTGRFADTVEIDSDSLSSYLIGRESFAHADQVTVEEYAGFFAKALKESEYVIHVMVGSKISYSYKIAKEAAKNFDHVYIIDSGQMSCGEGLLALYAAKFVEEGYRVEDIVSEIEKLKTKLRTRFVIPQNNILYKNGRTFKLAEVLCNTFKLHPYGGIFKDKFKVVALIGGSIENAWKTGIEWHFKNKAKIDTKIVVITHVGCNAKQIEYIKQEISKKVKFEKILVCKASFINACNAGWNSVGISYLLK